jgi:hypothetical protein
MNLNQIIIAFLIWTIAILISYSHIGFKNIKDCYNMLITKEYWTNYNTIEFVSWSSKAIILVPGLIFGIQLWWLYFLTLITSLSLIWASNKKLLPTLVAFNTLWSWISIVVICQHIF